MMSEQSESVGIQAKLVTLMRVKKIIYKCQQNIQNRSAQSCLKDQSQESEARANPTYSVMV